MMETCIDTSLDEENPTIYLVKADEMEEETGETEQVVAIRQQASYAYEHNLPVIKTIILFGQEFKFALVPPGTFMMGARDDEENAYKDEKPRHKVRIARPFYASIYQITQAQYLAVMGENPSVFRNHEGSDRFPVENVSWYNAQEFCKKFTEELDLLYPGMKARLPLEPEWEYMARAGSTTIFPWGNICNGTQANVNGQMPYGTTEKGPNLGRTCIVGSYPPNFWGLSDVIGNVWEWCLDEYVEHVYQERAALGEYVVGEGEQSSPFVVFAAVPGTAIRGTTAPPTASGKMPKNATTTSVFESSSEGEQSIPFAYEVAPGVATPGTAVPPSATGTMPTPASTSTASESLSEGEDSDPFAYEVDRGSTTPRVAVPPSATGSMPTTSTTDSVFESSSEGEQSIPFVPFVVVHGESIRRTVDQAIAGRSLPTTETNTSASDPLSEGEDGRPFVLGEEVVIATPSTVDRPTATGPTTSTETSASESLSEGEQGCPFVCEVDRGTSTQVFSAAPLFAPEPQHTNEIASSDSESSLSEDEHSRRWMRGGSFSCYASNCSLAYRYWCYSDHNNGLIGFRIIID